ncbi:hypothetical protein F2Q69_00005778 [Brassica cretica]|uniref:Uncharacterized protein n=1 Tax=Brassica cretica TaxID=69181 RepID=A0A8S9PFW0_BRACR|nr:hypothetical protein F2Q69_00005778 [Brassica cretica]
MDQVSRDLRSWQTLAKSGTTTVARPQRIKTGMRHKAGMGMRKPEEHTAYIHCKSTVKYMEQSKSCFSRRGKQRKPGTWVITPTPAPSKHVLVVALPRKAEYGPREKQNITGSQGTPGPYASPRSKNGTQGSPNDFGVPKIKKEARTPVQPRAHRGHYNFKEPPGSKQRSPDKNLRVPTRPQRPNTILEKKDRTPVQPRAHRGHYILEEPLGSHATSGSKYTRVPIRSPDLKENPILLCDLRVQSQSRKPPGSNHDLRIYHKISGFLHRLRAPVSVPGSREKIFGSRTKTSWSKGTSGLLRFPRRPPGPHATSGLQDQSPDSNSPYSSSKPPGL